MIMKEYCESMQRQLAAWRANVEKLLTIADALAGLAPSPDDHQQRESMQSLIEDIGRVTEMLKQECLVA